MKKRLVSRLLMIAAMVMLTGCCVSHEWQEATCIAPQTCSVCGKTKGETADHIWVEATCAEPKTCSVCGETEGELLAHSWVEATCAGPKTCSVCGQTEGKPLEHTWVEATYTEPKTCSVCGQTEGEPKPQPYVEANNLSFSQERSFIFQGFRYDTNDRSNYETTEINVQIESVTAEEGPEENFRTIHIVISEDGDIWSDGQGHSRLSLSMPGFYLYDMYTGRKVPAARFYNDMQVSSGLDVEWEGEPYRIDYTIETKWNQGGWRGEYSKLGVHVYFDITIPKDYDGLVAAISPLTEWEVEPEDEIGVVNEEEHYLMEDWKEDSRLFRIDDLL